MSENTSVNLNCGGILCPLLAVLFVGLKLTNCIDWSWWWVLSPLWIPFIIVVVVFAIITFVAALAGK